MFFDDVGRAQLVVVGLGGLVLAGVDRHLEDGVAEAAVARPVEARREVEGEDRARDRLRDGELRRHLVGDGEIALAAELECGQLDVECLAMLLPGVELGLPEIEARHPTSVDVAR